MMKLHSVSAGRVARWRALIQIALVAVLSVYAQGQNDYTTPYQFTTIAGKAGTPGTSDGTGSLARFNFPTALAIDSAGTVYVLDKENNAIREIDPSGAVTTLAGFSGAGWVDGTGRNAGFQFPTAIAVDANSNVYVTEWYGGIRKITPGGVVTTLFGLNSSQVQVSSVSGIAINTGGDCFITNWNIGASILRVKPYGAADVFAGSLSTFGFIDAKGSAARFLEPGGLAIDGSDNLYVIDTDTIRKIDSGASVSTIAGTVYTTGSNDGVGTAAHFNSPQGLAVDSKGNIFVTDTPNNLIRKITPAGVVSTVGGSIMGSDDGVGPYAKFNYPCGIAIDKDDNLYIADSSNHTIRKGSLAKPAAPKVVDLIDPFPGLQNGFGIITDKNALAAASSVNALNLPVNGAAADGVTRLILRAKVPTGTAKVTFTITGQTSLEDGKLGDISNSTPTGTSFQANVVQTSSGPMAFAIYYTPTTFSPASGGFDHVTDRSISVNVSLDGVAASPVAITLSRPPVLLVHGLWSSKAAWDKAEISKDPGFKNIVYAADYESSNAQSFEFNVENHNFIYWVANALRTQRSRGIAATQVDVIGHSMGGILARLYAQDSPTIEPSITSFDYRRGSNYWEGDFHTLVTFNTPHLGSPFASLLNQVLALPLVRKDLIAGTLRVFGKPIDDGAITDLSIGSDALNNLDSCKIPAYALDGAPTSLEFDVQNLYTLLNAFNSFERDKIFDNQANDGVVSVLSQQGGNPSHTTFTDALSDHLTCTSDPNYFDGPNGVFALLNTPATAIAQTFGYFPAVNTVSLTSSLALGGSHASAKQTMSSAVRRLSAPATKTALSTGTLTLAVVGNPTSAAPGATLQITLGFSGSAAVTKALAVGRGEVATVNANSSPQSFSLPANWIGSYSIQAFATLSDGTYATSNSVTVQVSPTAALTGLSSDSSQIAFDRFGQSETLHLTGAYGDGSSQAFSDGTMLQFTSNDPSVATVDSNGLLTAVGNGSTSIHVTDGSFSHDISVTVNTADEGSPPAGATLPIISVQPIQQTVSQGSPATFSVQATGSPAPTYQWFLNGVAISGAQSASYGIASVSTADLGTYSVSVANAAGLISSQSVALTIPVASQLVNISTRSFVGTGGSLQIAGFVIQGTASKRVLIRAGGPAIGKAPFNVPGTLDDPILTVFSGQNVVATNDDWDTSTSTLASTLGAYSWTAGSKDAALDLTLPPGPYTAEVTGKNNGTGIALIEVYDADPSSQNAKLVNISTRSETQTGANIQIAGFVIQGTQPKKVLIRAGGPAIAKPPFNVPGTLDDPVLTVFSGQNIVSSNDDWDPSLASTANTVGAYAWDAGSKDAALLLTLAPGPYTAEVTGKNGKTGVTLVEVYDAPQ